MKNQEIRDYIAEINADTAVFDNPDYDNSIIALTIDGAAVYDRDSMIAEYAADENISEEEAADTVDFNMSFMGGTLEGGTVTPVIIDSMSKAEIAWIKKQQEEKYEK